MRAAVMLTALILAAGCRLGGPWPEEEIPELEYRTRDATGIVDWVSENILLRWDDSLYGVAEYYALPQETYASGKGDCEDQVILALFLIERDLGVKGAMVMGKEHGKWWGHAWLVVDGVEYDPVFPYLFDHSEKYATTAVFGWDVVKALIGL